MVEAQKQRDALTLLETQMFSDQPFSFPPELYNQLVATQWLHWGSREVDREDYPVHETILLWQDRLLGKLLDPLTLARIHDSELKVPADQDAFTTAELLDRLTPARPVAAADATLTVLRAGHGVDGLLMSGNQ